MKRKIVSIIIAAQLIANFSSFNMAIAEQNTALIEEKFQAVGILREDYFSGDSIKRGSFAKLMVDFINMEASKSDGYTRFVDVEIDHDAVGAINLLFDMGHIAGNDGYKFDPDRNITYTEALNVILNSLGYKYMVDAQGDWRGNVISVANSLDLLDGVSCNWNSEAKKSELLKILDNALETKTANITPNPDGWAITSKEGETALAEFHDIYIKEGIVNANCYTSLTEANDIVDEGALYIDDEKFIGKSFTDFLGYSVKCYYSDEDGVLNVVYMEKDSVNNTYEIDGDEVYDINGDYLKYYDDEKDRKLKLSNVKIIFNGTAYTGYGQIGSIDFDDCDITALSNDNDTDIEVLFVTKYDDYYVSRTDKNNKTVYDNVNNRSVILNDDYVVEIYDVSGSKAGIDAITADSVISVAESRNTDGVVIKKVYVINNTAEGKIESIDNEEGYKISGSFYKQSPVNTQNMLLGQQVRVSLGRTGKIIARTILSQGKQFGIVYRSFPDEEDENKIYFEIYTLDGEFKKFWFEKKIKVDNVSVNADIDAVRETIPNGQAIVFEASEDKIKKIKLPKSADAERGEFRLLTEGDALDVRGNNGQNVFAGMVAATKDTTKIMLVPSTPSEREAYGLFGYANIESLRDKKYKVYTYTDNKLNSADVMVMIDASAVVLSDSTTTIHVIEEKYKGLDADDEAVTILRTSSKEGISAEIPVADELDTSVVSSHSINSNITKIRGVELKDVDEGDIIRISKNSLGQIVRMEKVYDFSDPDNEMSRLRPPSGLVDTCHYYTSGSETVKYKSSSRVLFSTVEICTDKFIQFKSNFYPSMADWEANTNMTWQTEISTMNTDGFIAYDSKTGTSKSVSRNDLKDYIGKDFVMTVNQCLLQGGIIYE